MEGFPLIRSTLDRRVSWFEEPEAASPKCGLVQPGAIYRQVYDLPFRKYSRFSSSRYCSYGKLHDSLGHLR